MTPTIQTSLQQTPSFYENWLLTLQRDDILMMAMMIYDYYLERFGMLKTAAAKEVGLLLGINEKKKKRKWRAEFRLNGGVLVR